MAAEPAYDDFESFNIDSQQNQQQAERIPARRFKTSFCRKGLMLLIFILLSVFLILLIAGVIKSSETNETVEEFQAQVQMQVSHALVNVSEKSELMDLELRIRNVVAQMGAAVMADLSRKLSNVITIFTRKLEMLPEPACSDLQCPRHWIHFNGSCYFFSTKKATWNSSNLYCSLRNSNLVVINDGNEQHFATFETGSKRFWIGLIDLNNNNNWQWVDGTAYETTPRFWMPGEPNDHNEGCVHLWVNGLWNDAPCSTRDYFICEKEPQQ